MAKPNKGTSAARQGNKEAPSVSEEPTSTGSSKRDNATDQEVSVKEGTGAEAEATPKPRWSGGSWKGKSTAVAEMTLESISSTATRASEAVQSTLPGSPSASSFASATGPSKRFSERLRTPSKSVATTKLYVSSEAQDTPAAPSGEKTLDPEMKGGTAKSQTETDGKVEKEEKDAVKGEDKNATTSQGGWLGWWGGRQEKDEKEQQETEGEANPAPTVGPVAKDQKSIPPPVVPPASDTHDKDQPPEPQVNPNANTSGDSNPEIKNTEDRVARSRASWFGLWGSGSSDTTGAIAAQKSPVAQPEASNIASDGYSALDEENKPTMDAPSSTAPQQTQSSWAFWSREGPKTKTPTANSKDAKPETGEIAVENTASESKPKPAQMSEGQQETSKRPASTKSDRIVEEATDAKKAKSAEKQISSDNQKPSDQVSKSAPVSGDESSQTGVEAPTGESAKSLRQKIQKLQRPNLLLPALHGTFHLAQSPSYWQQIFRIFGRGTQEEKRHLSLSPSLPKVRKALAIGVHGYFPAPLIARVLGQPTGTSLRFSNGAAAAIQKWADKKGYTCDIEKVALEGEGMIESRVDSLWKLLLNWIDQIRNADFIMIACHSQGVPVAMMLLARLINFGCLNPQARIGLCAMAGVNLGPFPSYQSRILDRSANELFEFSRPHSAVSQKYTDALATCLRHHVRIIYVGSIDDQLVSLESALFTTVSHPYIYRAVFVDGRIHAPGFVTHLVGLACKLRNLGIRDHGLIRELSGPLAGSLYTGEGHSRLYEDQAVYDLAVEHALETSTLAVDVSVETRDYEVPSTANANPYFLPWAMRGVLEEEFVRTELRAETEDLLKRFESWKPSSKVLKDVKFRLEAVRSKL